MFSKAIGREMKGFSKMAAPLGLIGLGMAAVGAGGSRGLAGSAIDTAMDAMFYSPELEDMGGKGSDIDNRLLGYDLNLEDVFTPLRAVDPRNWVGMRDFRNAFRIENFRNMASSTANSNRMMMTARSKYEQQTKNASSRMYGNDEYWDNEFGIPYYPSVQRTPYSNGDMVFGAYNRRHR
jgi:hypothetical protein